MLYVLIHFPLVVDVNNIIIITKLAEYIKPLNEGHFLAVAELMTSYRHPSHV